MTLASLAKNFFHNSLGEPEPRKNLGLSRKRGVVHIGRRAYCQAVTVGGTPCIKKVFATTTPGREAFASERAAYRILREYEWMPSWSGRGLNWFARPIYPSDCRLDRVACRLSYEERKKIAGDVLSVLLDLYVSGIAHRDVHAQNIFYINGGIKLIDFEAMAPYPIAARPTFDSCYDITGEGLESPDATGHMCFNCNHPLSVSRVLGVDVREAFAQLRSLLREEMHRSSVDFRSQLCGRHVCKSSLTYTTFDLPDMQVRRNEAQRDCGRRFQQFGINREVLHGKRLLDLGSNIGGMVFEATKFEPAEALGVEYDGKKVACSRRVAAFANLSDVRFIIGDVDHLSPRRVGGRYDVVFCLAIAAHVKRPERLYRLLGRLTRNILFFEGNANSNVADVERHLKSAGFRHVTYLGFCDDDILPANNRRPMWRAWK